MSGWTKRWKLYTPRHKCRGYNQKKHIIDQELHPICEQRHDKTNKMTYAQSEDTDQPLHLPSLISRRCPHEEPCTFSYPLSAQSSLGAQVILLFLLCNSSYDCHIIMPTLKLFLFPFTKPYTTVSKIEGSLGWWNIFVFPKEGKWVPKYDKDICIKTNWISVILE